jgi:methionine-rich copper-binding protein CopC
VESPSRISEKVAVTSAGAVATVEPSSGSVPVSAADIEGTHTMHDRNHRRTARPKGRRALGTALAALAGAGLALAASAPAAAHAALTGTDPEDGSTVATAPAEVTATFSEILDGDSTEIAVTGPDGAVVDAGPASFDGDTFTQPMRYTGPGDYTVAYRVISEDGHRVDGALTFTVTAVPDELLDPAAAATTEADAPATEPADDESTSDAAAADGDSNTGAVLAAVLLGVLVLVVGAVVGVRVLARRRGGAQ